MTYYSEFAILHGYFLKAENCMNPKKIKNASDVDKPENTYKRLYIKVSDRSHPRNSVRTVVVDFKEFVFMEGLNSGIYCYLIVAHTNNDGSRKFVDMSFTAEDIKFKFEKYQNHMFLEEDRRIQSDSNYYNHQRMLQEEVFKAREQFEDTFFNRDSCDVFFDDGFEVPF